MSNNITITYVVLTHNEVEVFALIDFIKQHKDKEDKILILNDPVNESFDNKLKKQSVKIINHKLEHRYDDHRNVVWPYIKTDYSFWLDSDEIPTELLIKNIKTIIANMREPDLLGIFRKNLFIGTTLWDALRYNWDLTDGNIIYWKRGDAQYRVAKSRKGLRFQGALHEMIRPEKHHRTVVLPKDMNLCLVHNKTIERQRESNRVYNEKYSQAENISGGSLDKSAIITK
jgi:hypothetical protein